jgi:hypothetical protein
MVGGVSSSLPSSSVTPLLCFSIEGGCCSRQVEGVGWCLWASCGLSLGVLGSSDRGGDRKVRWEMGCGGLRRVAVVVGVIGVR